MSGESKVGEIAVHPLVYYQKPAIGTDALENTPPIQAVFPGGGFAIGLPVKATETVPNVEDRHGVGILASAPMNQPIDIHQKQTFAYAFLVIAFINIVVTILLFSHATEIDLSKVEPGRGPLPSIFEKLSTTRTDIEKLNYGFVLFIIVFGAISVVTENVLGISAYCLAVVVNFFVGTYSLPYLIYSFRYLMDFFMLYLALIFRSRLMYAYLPIHLHRT